VHVAPYRFRNKSLLVRAERRFRGAFRALASCACSRNAGTLPEVRGGFSGSPSYVVDLAARAFTRCRPDLISALAAPL
jgi:hypothetical protein